ncbi:MAG TPA: OmpA family protein, partial [Minicystis sp.]|nr:OmpA family protein [Minicystis sp.]
IAPNILEACKIQQRKAFFEFDSANLSTPDASTLEQVATCLTSGPLAGSEIVVVGHADPRGTDQYNMRLGMRRAESVRSFLVGRGVHAGAVQAESVGERGAIQDRSGWAWDRRVGIRLK